MKEQKKKRIVVTLLIVLCFISGYLLFNAPANTHRLKNLAQADSLILNELYKFNISDDQIRTTTVNVDPHFERKKYRVRIPPAISQTQIHTELNKALHPYEVGTPAEVIFPDQDVDIHFLYNQTVIRTVSFETDLSVNINRHRASVLVYFQNLPSRDLIEKVQQLGEPIPLVIAVENPMEVNEISEKLGEVYSRLIFWLQDNRQQDLISNDPSTAFTKLRQIYDVRPHTTVLVPQLDEKINTLSSFTDIDLNYVALKSDKILTESHGRKIFKERLSEMENKFPPQKIIIEGTKSTLKWLKEDLSTIKKNGVYLVSPPTNNF